jgi:ATP-binding cassette subfamily B protein
MFHGGGWYSYLRSGDQKPQKVTRELLLRVLAYARPYWNHIGGMLVTILFTTGLSLVSPLIFRQLIDKVLPSKNLNQLVIYALALLLVPLVSGGINVVQRRLNATVGEGVIYDLRVALFSRLQRMSLRFFTNTKVGELMSRLNNDVVGAQNAISNTIVGIATNIVQTIAILAVMLTLEWRLTIVSVLILPLFILAAQRLGTVLRDIARQAMDQNAAMNAHMNETLNIGGALLVKLFGRAKEEEERFRQRAQGVRDIGIRRAVVGSSFFVIIGLVSAVGTALVYGLGGYFVIRNNFTVGTIVAFGSYLTTLYGALQGLAGAPVEFSTSMVSFERVFEVIDLPQDIAEKEDAIALRDVHGDLEFEDVTFVYSVDASKLLSDVKRYGRMDNVTAVLSGGGENGKKNGMEKSRMKASQLPGRSSYFSGPRHGPRVRLVSCLRRTVGRLSRSLRCGQDHHDLSDPASVRPNRGRHPHRRARPARPDARLAFVRHRHGDAGDLPVPRHHPHQPDLRQTGRDPGRDRSGGAGGQHSPVHHRAA